MKERDKFKNSPVFEGIVSFRSVISSIEKGKSDRKILKVFYDLENTKKRPREYSFLKAKSYEFGYELIETDRNEIDSMTLGNTHGGIVFECTERTYLPASECAPEENGFYVMADGIEDPYNFGYALRSFRAAGVTGVILSKRNWLGASGVVCRASAGASEEMDFFVSDDYSFVEKFKSSGYKIICSDTENCVSMYDSDLKKPLLLVVGGEKRGISGSLLKQADAIVRIDYASDIPSALSAASAATVLAFEVFRQNRK